MKHPKNAVPIETGPGKGSYVINGSYQILNGETVSSGAEVRELFTQGLFKYQFLRCIGNPDRRSRIMRCSRASEAEWLAGAVDSGDLIVVAPTG
jgi:hypothetical protein